MNSHPVLMGLTVAIILIFVGISGCDTPTPLSSLPSVIYYYADNETRLYVTGDEHMYDQINISIENQSRIENYSYGLGYSTNKMDFSLEIRVLDNEGDEEETKYKHYTYSAIVRVEMDEEKVEYIIIDNHNEKEVTREAPYKTIMERET